MHVSEIQLKNFKSFPKASVKLEVGFNAIVGPNGSGKCLRGDSQVLLSDGRYLPIAGLVESELASSSQKNILDDGVVSLENGDGLSVFAINPATGKTETKRIQAFVRRSSPEKLLQIKTAAGKEVVATAYHPLMTICDGRIVAARADELTRGSFVATPRKLQFEVTESDFVEKLSIFSNRLYLAKTSCETLLRIMRSKKGRDQKSWKQISLEAGATHLALKGLLDGQSISLENARKLTTYLGLGKLETTELLRSLKAKNASKEITLPTTMSVELAKLVGYVISEGRIAENEVFFFNDSETLRNDFAECSEKCFGIRPIDCLNGEKVFQILPSKVVTAFLSACFGLDEKQHSSKKKMPPDFLTARLDDAAAFLSALYDGDGSVSKSNSPKICIEYTSASKRLVQSLQTLLLRFGIVARLGETEKYASNTEKKTRRTYYRLSVYGIENAAKMLEALKFSFEKRARLEQVFLERQEKPTGNNVDVVPNSNNLIKGLLQKAGYTNRKLKAVRPSKLRAYYENRCAATRQGIRAAMTAAGVQCEESQTLEMLANSDIFWDRITEIREVPGEEWVYDLCVEGNHNFLAEGLFVHNSNVVDSLLFAFGESSLKSMRVKKSTDLIFRNHSVAEVTVILDDKGAKKTVSRLVNRKGDTKYLLDGKRTKKYALEEFLSRNNISLSNIIKQGQVQQIVEMNPRDRRALIDRVANISEYEQKKKEAMGELSTVEERLKEATAILGEREGYLKELESEKNNALKFRELKKEIDSLKATLISIDLRAHEKHYEDAVTEMLGLENKASAIMAKIRGLESQIALKNSEKDAINQQIIVKSTGTEAELQRTIDGLNNAIANNRKAMEEKKARLAETEEKLKGKSLERQRAFDEVKGAMGRLSEVKRELESVTSKLKERTAEYNQLLSASAGFSHDFHEARSFVQRSGDEMLSLKEKLGGLQAEVASTQEIIDFKQRELERMKAGQLEDFSEKKKTLAAEREKFSSQLKEAQKALDELFREEKKLNERIPVLEDLLLMAREKKAELSSRLRTLGETQMGKAVEAVMALQEKLPGIYGTVEDLISYDSSYATPVQIALGNRANFVVADNSRTAAKAIEFLKQRKLGRISFIPLDKIRSQGLSKEDKELARTKGALGFIVDLLEFDEKHRKAAEFAAGNTLLMRDMPATEALIGKIRMVTREGELVEPSGLLTGGSYTAKINATLEKKKLEEWDEKASNAQSEKEGVLQALRELRDKMGEARKAKAEVELQLTTVSVQEKNIVEREAGEQGKAANARSAVQQTRDEISAGRSKIDSLNEERKVLVQRLSEINLKMLEAKQKIDVEKEAQLGNAVKEKERALSDLKVALSERENRLASIQTQYNVYEKQAYSLEKEELEARQLCDQLSNAVKEADKAITSGKKTLAERTEEQKKVSKAFSVLLEKREAIDAEIIRKGNEKGKMEFEREAAEREHGEMKVKRAVLETQLTQLKATFDEYKEAPVLADKSEKEKPELLARTKEIDYVLREIGSVNMRAIELFEQKLAEFEAQKTRVTQLFNEKEAVISVINEIESKKSTTFLNTFNAINENFKQIFSKVFQGDGHLYLDNPANPLEGGLTIEVKLDNKEVKYLELMSGGEKSLIALCFLLAMQAVTPSTIYILDEADAALDDENSRKLGQLVKTLASGGTQFIIVTHNQQVYKVADCLVGAAMGKEGSAIVEVKLNA